jgi:RNA recognition motif-containing protein
MGDPQIYVRGFAKYTTEEELRNIFAAFGDIREIRMIRDYAFIVPYPRCRSLKQKMQCKKLSTA